MSNNTLNKLCIVLFILELLLSGCYFMQPTIKDPKEISFVEESVITTSEFTEQHTIPITEPELYKSSAVETSIIEPTETLETICEVIEEPETIETKPTVSEEDIELLAMVIYQEAGSDYICDDCRRRVGDVVLNRVEHDYFPNTIEEVLTREGQYGEYYWTGVVWPERASYSCEIHAVERARNIAREILEGNHSEVYGNGYIWQAGFEQGSDGFWCCGIYFGKERD